MFSNCPTSVATYLQEAPLNLSDINGRIEALAHIHDDVSAENLVVTSQTVDLHHRASAAKSVVSSLPLTRLKVETCIWDSVDISRVIVTSG